MENKLIIDSFDYYDKNKDKDYEKRFYFWEKELSKNDNEKSKIVFYDKNNKKVLEGNIELIGSHNTNIRLWTWGWAQLKLPKNLTYRSRKLLNYGLDIIFDEENNNITDIYLKNILISSEININNDLQLDMLLAISSYLTKIPDIIRVREKYDIYYYFLTNIKLY
jgi:hypothetical protein